MKASSPPLTSWPVVGAVCARLGQGRRQRTETSIFARSSRRHRLLRHRAARFSVLTRHRLYQARHRRSTTQGGAPQTSQSVTEKLSGFINPPVSYAGDPRVEAIPTVNPPPLDPESLLHSGQRLGRVVAQGLNAGGGRPGWRDQPSWRNGADERVADDQGTAR